MGREHPGDPGRPSRRTVVFGALGLLGAANASAACTGVPRPTPDLDQRLIAFTSAMRTDAPYRPPTAGERSAAVTGLEELAANGRGAGALSRWGFTTRQVSDGPDGAPYTLAATEPGDVRAWGLYLFPRSGDPTVIVEVPHPHSDLDTELVALELLRASPTCAILEAGAHRVAADSSADVAHRADSLFHAVALALARRYRVPQVQLHGFDDGEDSPDADVIISAGSARVGSDIERAATRLEREGLDVCRAWDEDCDDLEGKTNVQGLASRDPGLVFIHLEMSRAVRADPMSRRVVARSLVGSLRV